MATIGSRAASLGAPTRRPRAVRVAAGLLLGLVVTMTSVPAAHAADAEPPRLSFFDVSLVTAIEPVGFSRSITYVTGGHAHYPTTLDDYEQFFDALADGVTTIDRSSTQSEDRWVVTFRADSAEDLVARTDLALRSDSSAFAVDEAANVDQANVNQSAPQPRGTLRVVNYAECRAICLPTVGPLTDTLTPPLGWRLAPAPDQTPEPAQTEPDHAPTQDPDTGAVTYALIAARPDLVLIGPPRFASVRTSLDLGLTGAVTWRADFTVDGAVAAEDAATLVGVLERTPIPDGLAATRGDEGTVYTVRLAAPSAHEFLAEYRAWSGEVASALTRYPLPGSNAVVERFRLEVDLRVDARLCAHLPDEGIVHSVGVPFGQRATPADGPAPSGSVDARAPAPTSDANAPYAVDVAGASPLALLLLAVFAVLALLAIGAALHLARRRRSRTPSGPRAPLGSPHLHAR